MVEQASDPQLLWQAVLGFLAAAGNLLKVVSQIGVQHAVALTWVAFFLFVVRWPDLRDILRKGGWVAAVLLYFLVCWTWGVCTASGEGILGYRLASIPEKFLLGAFWVLIAYLCGLIQETWSLIPPEVEIAGPPEPVAGGHGHGHHGHDDHGHGHH